MTDNFAFINSGNDFDVDNTQNSTGFENLMGMMSETQSQYEQEPVGPRGKENTSMLLETIMEEPSNINMPSVQNQSDGMQFRGGNSRSNLLNSYGGKANSIGDKLEYLSQEVDQLYEETQKVSSKKISTENNTVKNNMPNPFQFAGGNINRVSVPQMVQSVNNSSNMQMKSMPLKGNATPNTAMTGMNPKPAYLNSNFPSSANPNIMKTKAKSSLGANSAYYPDYRGNPGNEQNSNFISQTDRLINNYVMALDEIKATFCSRIDREKNSFIANAERIKEILAFENDFNQMEEEKNKVLDNRMECLFKEMMSLLSEFNGFLN